MNQPLAFSEGPELFLERSRKRYALPLKRLLAVIYLFGGLYSLIAVLSTFVITPLLEQLTADRSSYATLARKLMQKSNAKLTNMLKSVPRVVNVDPNAGKQKSQETVAYFDAQTQTADPAAGIVTGGEDTKIAKEIETVRQGTLALSQLDVITEKDPYADLRSSLDDLTSALHKYTYRLVEPESHKNLMDGLRKEARSTKGMLLGGI